MPGSRLCCEAKQVLLGNTHRRCCSHSLQAVWRAHLSVKRARAETRALWMQRYGPSGELATPADLAASSSYLRQLLFFADPASPADLPLIATACRLALATSPSSSQPQLCAAAADGPAAAAAIALRAQRLAGLAVEALASHASSLQASLASPRPSVAARGDQAAALVEAVITLTAGEAWKAAVGAGAAPRVAAQVLAHAAARGLFHMLAVVVATGCPEDGGAAGRQGVPLAETLCTALVVRYLSAQGEFMASSPSSPSSATARAV